jgi:hypothetical protein
MVLAIKGQPGGHFGQGGVIRLCQLIGQTPELIDGGKRYQFDMSVRNLNTLDNFTNETRLNHRPKLVGYPPNCFHKRLVVVIFEIPDESDLFLGDYQRMAGLNRVNVQESERLGIFENFVAGNLAVNDFGKYCLLHIPSIYDQC